MSDAFRFIQFCAFVVIPENISPVAPLRGLPTSGKIEAAYRRACSRPQALL